MPSIVVDVTTKSLLFTALAVTLAVLAGSAIFLTASDAGPEIREGSFVDDSGSGFLAVSDTTCSTEFECETTVCDGTNYLVDTDDALSCDDHDGDNKEECMGYEKTYADAEHCGGRYDYNCDSTGCEGYKAACEDDCSANAGCDTYDFCSDSADSSPSTASCTDQCQSLVAKCSGGNIVQCQDTDTDSCTDGFVKIAACDGGCSNAACNAVDEAADTTTAPETQPEPDTDTQTLDQQIAEVWTDVWTTVFGWI